ncbi:unnamed protein product [Wuchereria bancrofti]|uniref:Uncharacterized protein n=1 Tax=Wuchereria bancrofti TaxID=6293 RepID=A0A3P7DIC2_WUCBA|nr:unnamed protein product [Wuchereria bancrofti]
MAFYIEMLFVQQLILKDFWTKTSIGSGGNVFQSEDAFGVYVKRQACDDGFGFCMKMAFTFEDSGTEVQRG